MRKGSQVPEHAPGDEFSVGAIKKSPRHTHTHTHIRMDTLYLVSRLFSGSRWSLCLYPQLIRALLTHDTDCSWETWRSSCWGVRLRGHHRQWVFIPPPKARKRKLDLKSFAVHLVSESTQGARGLMGLLTERNASEVMFGDHMAFLFSNSAPTRTLFPQSKIRMLVMLSTQL